MDYIDVKANNLITSDASPMFAWVLLLPLFFIAGWYTHDIIQRNEVSIKPQVGIGGGSGPLDTDPGIRLHIYEIAPETSLPLVDSPTPTPRFNGQSAIEEI